MRGVRWQGEPGVPNAEDVARFWSKVDRSGGADACWPWLAGRKDNGYGHFSFGPLRTLQNRYAHRLAYELLVGPIPRGLDLDHLCRVRHCVNPRHLEPVTRRENLLRGETLPASNARRTHCLHGHEYTPENTRVNRRGDRACRVCDRERARAYAARNRAA